MEQFKIVPLLCVHIVLQLFTRSILAQIPDPVNPNPSPNRQKNKNWSNNENTEANILTFLVFYDLITICIKSLCPFAAVHFTKYLGANRHDTLRRYRYREELKERTW